jgi:hypothetical protein
MGKDDDLLQGFGARAAVPKIAPGVDWRALALDPREGFILSRVDGRTTLGDICLLTPFPLADTVRMLRSLHQNGVLEVPGLPTMPRPAPPTAPAAAPAPESSSGASGRVMAAGGAAESEKLTNKVRAEESPTREWRSDDDVELPPELRRRIDEVFAIIERGASPRQLLELADDSDIKEVRRAYFRLSKEFHPDRYFGRQLGPYKRRLQVVFAALTDAFKRLSEETKSNPRG